MAEVLAKLPGKKSTATTKGTPSTKAVLERFGLLEYFDHVQGTDGFPAKPHPDVIFKALEGLGAKPKDCLFIGDSPADMEAARRAGVKACAVTYGYGRREDLAVWSPDYWLDNLAELVDSTDRGHHGSVNGASNRKVSTLSDGIFTCWPWVNS